MFRFVIVLSSFINDEKSNRIIFDKYLLHSYYVQNTVLNISLGKAHSTGEKYPVEHSAYLVDPTVLAFHSQHSAQSQPSPS